MIQYILSIIITYYISHIRMPGPIFDILDVVGRVSCTLQYIQEWFTKQPPRTQRARIFTKQMNGALIDFGNHELQLLWACAWAAQNSTIPTDVFIAKWRIPKVSISLTAAMECSNCNLQSIHI